MRSPGNYKRSKMHITVSSRSNHLIYAIRGQISVSHRPSAQRRIGKSCSVNWNYTGDLDHRISESYDRIIKNI